MNKVYYWLEFVILVRMEAVCTHGKGEQSQKIKEILRGWKFLARGQRNGVAIAEERDHLERLVDPRKLRKPWARDGAVTCSATPIHKRLEGVTPI